MLDDVGEFGDFYRAVVEEGFLLGHWERGEVSVNERDGNYIDGSAISVAIGEL